jgi:hypothetical protein
MTFRDNVTCKHCGSTVRRKRFGQRYCSKHCRDIAAVKRQRARSANNGALEKASETAPLPPYREALTSGLQGIDLSGVSGADLSIYARALRRPIVNVSGRGISRELLAHIVHIECERTPRRNSAEARRRAMRTRPPNAKAAPGHEGGNREDQA